MKTRNQIAAFAALLALTGCNPNTPSGGDQPAGSPGSTGAVLELPKNTPAIAENKDTFITAMNQKLAEFDAKLDELADKSAGYKDEAKVQAEAALASLREQRGKLDTQFAELKQSSAEAWKDVKTGFQAAFAELEKAFENAKSKFS